MHLEFLADRLEAIPIIAKWYFDQWGHLVAGCSLETFRTTISEATNRDKPPLVILAVEGETVIGAAELKPHEMLSVFPDYTPWIGGVYVAADHRNGGIASLLARKIIELAESFGAEQLFLQTTRLDGGLYTHLGWRPVQQVNYRGEDVLVMELPLTSG